MHLRTVLILLLVTSILAMLVLLPRSPMVLGWLWQNAQDIAAEQGFTLEADRLHGNAWGGVSIEGLSLGGPGTELSSANARIQYGLLSLLGGSLTMSAELSGVRGNFDPAFLIEDSLSSASGIDLPINLQHLTLSDINISIAEFELYLPAVSVDELEVTSQQDTLVLNGALTTPDGAVTFEGAWLPDPALLELNIVHADVTIARHWWPEAAGGRLTGQMRWSHAGGVELDTFIHDGSIDYLELEVTGINGPVTMRDLIIESELKGTGLGGPVGAEVVVDIPGLHYQGILTGSPRLAEAVPWMGRNLGIDLRQIPADGPMNMRAVVSGWYETQVTGTANATGNLAGMELTALHGDFDFRTAQGISVDARAQLGGGQLTVLLLPTNPRVTELAVSVVDVQPFSGAADVLLNGQGQVHFDSTGAEPLQSSASLTLTGDLLQEPFTVQADGASSDTVTWTVDLAGSTGATQQALTGQALLDLEAGSVTGIVDLTQLELAGLPWPVDAQASIQAAPLELPLPVTVSAAAGPVTLADQTYSLAFTDGFSVSATDGSLKLHIGNGETHLTLNEPPLLLALPDQEALNVPVQGELQSAAGGLRGEVSTVADVAGQTVEATVTAGAGTMNLQGSSNLLGLDWLLAGSLTPELNLSASSPAGTITLRDSSLEGSGELPIPAGIEVLQGGEWREVLQWQLAGDVLAGGASITAGSSSVQVEWQDGFAVTAGVSQELRVLGQEEVLLTGELGLDGLISGQLVHNALSIDVAGPFADARILLSSDFPASSVQDSLAGSVQLAGHLDWQDGFELVAGLDWQELNATLEWRADSEPQFAADAPGLTASFEADGLHALLQDFDLNPFVSLPLEVPPVTGSVSGPLGELRVDVATASGWLEAQLTGGLSPELDLALVASAVDGLVQLQGNLRGPAGETELTGSLTSAGLGDPEVIGLEPLTLQLALDPAGQLVASGDGINLRLDDSAWSGSAQLPVWILGEQHNLLMEPAGEGLQPVLRGDLSGPFATGEIHFDDVIELDLSIAENLPGLDLLTGANLNATSDLSGNWSARLQASAAGPTASLAPVTLGAELTGDLAGFTGIGNLRGGPEGTRLLTINAASDWSSVEVTSDLASLAINNLAALHGLDTDIEPGGEASFSVSTDGPTWDISAALAGTAAGTPLDLLITADASQVHASGSAAGEPLLLTLTPGETSELHADWGGAELHATITQSLTIFGRLTAPEGSPLSLPADLTFSTAGLDGVTELNHLRGTVGPASLELSGPLLPDVNLQGNIELAELPEALPLSVTQADAGPRATVSYQGLLLTAGLDQGALELRLTGDLADGIIRSALGWSSSDGFSGNASGSGHLEVGTASFPWQITAHGTEAGDLAATGTLRHASQPEGRSPLAHVEATVGRQPFVRGSVSGAFSSYLNVVDLWPAAGSGSLTMSASGRLAGNLLDPSLSGSVMLQGAVQAAGRIDASLSGVQLDVTGEDTSLSANLQGSDWQIDVSTNSVPLDRFTDMLPGAVLNLVITGAGSLAEGNHELTLQSANIRHEQASVIAGGSFRDGELNAQVELAANLAALDVGLAMSGQATGNLELAGWRPLEAGSGTLAGAVDISSLGVAGSPGLAGSIRLAGTPASPQVTASLDAEGVADSLEFDWRPAAESFRLAAQLDLGPVQTDIYMQSSRSEGPSGAGTVRVPGGSFTLSTLESGEFLFSGHSGWSDWGLLLDTREASVTASGNLGALSKEVAGALELSARLGAGGAEFSGGITALSAFGVEAGDVSFGTLTGSNPGLSLTGDLLQGYVRLSGNWQLDRVTIPLAPELELVASASGDLSGGNLNAILSGSILDGPLTGQVAASLTSQGVSVDADIQVMGGQAAMAALLRGGTWQGTVELGGLLYSGIELNGTGLIHGPTADPHLELTTDANLLGIPGEGTLQLGRDLFRFHQTFTGADLGGELVFQGSLWPEPRLLLSGHNGNTFRLEQAEATAEQPVLERSLISSGQLNLRGDVAEVDLQAAGDGDSARISVELPILPGFEVDGHLQLASLRDLLTQLDAGVELSGRGDTTGDLTLNLFSGQLELAGFGLAVGPGQVLLDGYVNLSGSARLSGHFQPQAPWLLELPSLASRRAVPFALISSGGIFRFVSNSSLGDIEASYSVTENRGTLTAFLNSGDGGADISLAWSDASGASGTIVSNGFVLFDLPDDPPGLVNTDLTFADGQVSGTASLIAGGGRLNASGHWALGDLLPRGIDPLQLTGGEADLRVSSLEISELPPVALYLPALTGGITAVIQFRNDIIAGNLIATDLKAAGSPLPIEAVISGSPRSIEIGAQLAGSPLSITLEDYTVSGLLDMRRFPLQTFAEAAAGPLDVLAEVTGVTRFAVPMFNLAASEFSVATEHIHLERSGIVTTGNISMELASGVFQLSEASFSGAGSWEASGVLREDLLDFELVADDADFSPMLGLIPVLNQLGVNVEGSLRLAATGDLANPEISLVSDSLEFEVAGISYRLDDLLLALQENVLTLGADLLATDPIQGALSLSGTGGLTLSPFAFEDAHFTFGGSLVLPVIGQVQEISGSLHSADETPGAPLMAEIDAILGNPLSIRGSLAPLDLTLTGNSLLVDLPGIFLADSRLDADLNLRLDDGLALGGTVTLHEGQLSLGGSPEGEGGLTATGFADDFRFDGLRIVVPARLRLAESFGSAELSGDITLGGTLAEPFLSGRADALRGNFQFAGRDFALQEGSAVFDATRGMYPELFLSATTTMDRGRLLPAGSNLQLVAPAEGNALVSLTFSGTIEPDSETGIRLDLNPLLTSNVLVRSQTSGGQSSGPRPLTDDELLALVTLGRVDFDALGGESGLGTAVAQGAIETAFDLLIMSELQRALGEALGLDLVEIRSSALANILSGEVQDQQFGVSLRFGGYVSDEVFATYRVSAFDDPEGIYSFSNEVGIRYALGPVLLDLAGSLGVTDSDVLSAVAQLSLGIQYELNPNTSIEAAFDVSSQEQLFRFGVTWRW